MSPGLQHNNDYCCGLSTCKNGFMKRQKHQRTSRDVFCTPLFIGRSTIWQRAFNSIKQLLLDKLTVAELINTLIAFYEHLKFRSHVHNSSPAPTECVLRRTKQIHTRTPSIFKKKVKWPLFLTKASWHEDLWVY